jgi:predicted acetyltransferase
MQYRFGTIDDARVLAQFNHALIRDEGHRNPMTVEELETRMAGWISGEYKAVVFMDGESPVGYVLYRHDPEYIYLRQLFVIPEYRRCGVGRDAIQWLQKEVWGKNCRVRVEVLVGNRVALAFWRAAGFADYCLTLELEGSAEAPETTGPKVE